MAEFRINKYNYSTVTGRLTSDPRVYRRDNYSIANFTVAHGKRKKVGNEWVDDKTIFIPCSMFNCPCLESLHKGAKVKVEGSIDQESWEKDGQSHSRLILRVANIGVDGTEAQMPVAPRTETQVVNETVADVFGGDVGSDIPF